MSPIATPCGWDLKATCQKSPLKHLAARRQQILDAALICFDRSGFHRSPMQDIFDQSGLSAGAVYRYFASKEDIIEAIAEATPQPREAELIAEAVRAVRVTPRRLCTAWPISTSGGSPTPTSNGDGVSASRSGPKPSSTTGCIRSCSEERTSASYWPSTCAAHRLEGRLKDDLDPEALTRVYLSLFQGFILQQSLDPDVDVGHYLRALHSIIDSTMPDPETTGS